MRDAGTPSAIRASRIVAAVARAWRSDIAAPLELITQASPARRYTRKASHTARGAVDVEDRERFAVPVRQRIVRRAEQDDGDAARRQVGRADRLKTAHQQPADPVGDGVGARHEQSIVTARRNLRAAFDAGRRASHAAAAAIRQATPVKENRKARMLAGRKRHSVPVSYREGWLRWGKQETFSN